MLTTPNKATLKNFMNSSSVEGAYSFIAISFFSFIASHIDLKAAAGAVDFILGMAAKAAPIITLYFLHTDRVNKILARFYNLFRRKKQD